MTIKHASATGLVPDEAAIRAELTEARQEAADSLAILDAIADYVGCPHDEELTVDHVRQHYMKLENAAQRQGVEDAGRIANAQAYSAEREAAVRADEREKQRERDAEIADCIGDKYDATSFMSPNAEQVAALRSKEQAAHEIAAAIRSGGGK